MAAAGEPTPVHRHTPRTPACIGLGSNLGDSRRQLERALAGLERVPASRLTAWSRAWVTRPWGQTRQPPFWNAAALLHTDLTPLRLLHQLLALEWRLGRRRAGRRWGPRAIDLDLLLYGHQRVNQAALHVPHPWLHRRAFALAPLTDIDPGWIVPGHGPARRLLRRTGDTTAYPSPRILRPAPVDPQQRRTPV